MSEYAGKVLWVGKERKKAFDAVVLEGAEWVGLVRIQKVDRHLLEEVPADYVTPEGVRAALEGRGEASAAGRASARSRTSAVRDGAVCEDGRATASEGAHDAISRELRFDGVGTCFTPAWDVIRHHQPWTPTLVA